MGIALFGLIYGITHAGYKRIIMFVLAGIAAIVATIYFLMAGRRKVNIKFGIDIEEE